MEKISEIISLVANLFTIGASGIALYLFFFQRGKISNAFNLLLNYSTQLTLSELKSKLDRLNHFNANDTKQKEEVINILHEIQGQTTGNLFLKENLNNIIEKIEGFIEKPKNLTEPRKRSLVHELRESIRNLDFDSYNKIIKK
ncbi:hypothetical protein VOI54_12270 [Tamlana sp. 2201CG12-4]|uniref:hypothetical protein n=1 Tax=Tamlana sp. 2201CG12-4 TaxID=3112582 RepID=UPI002DB922B0|nr:hypothetical protein [Tamlana sp. 2201CG12-4]MEC3907797.1 hypothetical protein [Tamlana sp. 2201CG12-4]